MFHSTINVELVYRTHSPYCFNPVSLPYKHISHTYILHVPLAFSGTNYCLAPPLIITSHIIMCMTVDLMFSRVRLLSAMIVTGVGSGKLEL